MKRLKECQVHSNASKCIPNVYLHIPTKVVYNCFKYIVMLLVSLSIILIVLASGDLGCMDDLNGELDNIGSTLTNVFQMFTRQPVA